MKKFHIDPLASPFVLESFRKYRDGLTMKEIRDWLNENGIKNPVGGAFTYNSVEHMLKNRRYIGELKFRDVVVPDAIPPIVPLELFDDVQEKIAKNKKAPARRKAEDDYLLTTKLHCGYCGALMFGAAASLNMPPRMDRSSFAPQSASNMLNTLGSVSTAARATLTEISSAP